MNVRIYKIYRTPDGDFLSTRELKKYYKLGFYTIKARFSSWPGWEVLEPTHKRVYVNERLGVYGYSHEKLSVKFNCSPNFIKYQLDKSINNWCVITPLIDGIAEKLSHLTEVI